MPRVFNEPVSLTWSELGTRDVESAKRFYSAVFGWKPSGDDYVHWELNGKSIGGCVDLASVGVAGDVPANWLSYFAVRNVNETAERVKQLGGMVNRPPTDIPNMGRFSVVCDPQGAYLAIFSS